jgi:predicted Zn finger-like uncharacterized protein
VFVCPGCKSRFRIKRAPKSGKVKCPKCELVSQIKVTKTPPEGLPRPAEVAAEGPPSTGPPPLTPQPAPPTPPGPPRAPSETPADPPPELEPGTEISGHKITDYLGGTKYTGSYRASQTSMGRTVLFKVLRKEYAGDEPAKAQFFAGARAAARLNHPNLLSVFDMGEAEGVCFYTTEFVEGGTLPEYLASRERISSEDRLAIATQIAQALAHAEATGVEHVWIGPEDVLLTDKGDVRVSRVGTGTPIGGGRPEPILTAVARLAYLAATDSDLPPEARSLSDIDSLAMPAARDATGTKLNALVARLVTERQAAYKTCEEFAAELEEFRESIQRRSTVSAAAAPGGVVPLRIQRARTRNTSMRTILVIVAVITALVFAIAAAIFFSVRGSLAEREATELYETEIEPILKGPEEGLRAALPLLKRLYLKYPETNYGKQAPTAIENVKKRIVLYEFRTVRNQFKDKPDEVAALIAKLGAKQAELNREFPGLRFVDEQARINMKNAHVRLDRQARRDWERNVESAVRSLYSRRQLHFGEALKEVETYRVRWADSDYAKKLAEKWSEHIRSRARKTFDEMVADAEAKHAEGKEREAQNILDRIVRNFGLPEFVDKARARKRQLQNN